MNSRGNGELASNENVLEQSSDPGTSNRSNPSSSPENEFREASPISRRERGLNRRNSRIHIITIKNEENERDEIREASPHRTNHHGINLSSPEPREASPISRRDRGLNHRNSRLRNITTEDEDNERDEVRERSPHRTNNHGLHIYSPELWEAFPTSRRERGLNHRNSRIRNITTEEEGTERDEVRERSPHRSNHHQIHQVGWSGLKKRLLRDYHSSKSLSNSTSLVFFNRGMTQNEIDEIVSYFTLAEDHNSSHVPLYGRYPRTLPMILAAGYNCKDIQSLSHALNPSYCIFETHSLDLVFRAALKKLAKEIHEKSVRENTQPFTNDRYLEISLIGKIRQYYIDHYKIDIILFLLRMDLENEHALHYLVYNSASMPYIKKLFRKYDITEKKIDNLGVNSFNSLTFLTENTVFPDIESSLTVNLQIIDDLTLVVKDVRRQCVEMNPKNLNTLCQSFLSYSSMKSVLFLTSYREGFRRMLLISELATWLCYGVTSNADFETLNLTQSIILIEVLRKMHTDMDKMIAWNYPLLCWYKRG